jgi:hypothetical protein
MSVTLLEFEVRPEFLEKLKEKPWLNFIPEFAKDTQGQVYMRKRGSLVIYKEVKRKNKLGYVCIICGSKILCSDISHLFLDVCTNQFNLEKCLYESIPYCPKCEKIPEYVGKSISI